jgi:hypothetical protein
MTAPGYRDGWCIHYRSPSQGLGRADLLTCEAGVEYAKFRGEKFDHRPCFLDKGKSRPGAAHCDQLRLPTAEEIATREIWHKERMAKLTTVMVGIMPWREKNKGRSATEIIACPACKGALHLSISSYNGHVHGRCETPDCVSWME